MGRHVQWRWARRLFGVAVTLAVLPSGRASIADSEPKLYVYLPSTVRPPMLQKLLSEGLPETTVMVFRHLRDFETSIEESPPDFVISARPFVDQHQGWTTVLQGFANHHPDEACVLLSVGEAADPAVVAGIGVGVVDLLGKKAMPNFVARLLGIQSLPKLTRVAQPEDLLPLLELHLAQAVLMPSRGVPALRQRSSLDLRAVELKEARMGLPALAAVTTKAAADDIQRKLMRLPAKTQSMLGVDEWRRP